ncbi:hypothetical protein ACRALDRAFT_2047051 [Sodiomyces alcalophilus JCM 7366]|uniref:uncharacterized protein n=1 Tax=Sodiomyces alcalophilus JCM 7366 TaxID=591952 RepID=UPI0039B3B0D1
MSTLTADIPFDFLFPSCEPAALPHFVFDPSLLQMPSNPGHARSTSSSSAYSAVSSAADSYPESVSTRMTTPSRTSPPIRQHGPILLPKIRSQDQAFESPPKRFKSTSPPVSGGPPKRPTFRPSHNRSYTSPESITWGMPYVDPNPTPPQSDTSTASPFSSSLLCSPVHFADDDFQPRRASTCSLDGDAIEKYGFPTYRQMASYGPLAPASTQHVADSFTFSSYAPRAPSPLSMSSTPEPVPSTTLFSYLTGPNPAPALVRTISYPLRDPHTKHFWWDVRQVRSWSDFSTSTILSLPGASGLLNCPVPAPLLPNPPASARHPETEGALHSIYAAHYLPKLNAALAISSNRPLQFSTVAPKPSASSGLSDPLFVANAQGDSSSAAAIFGGKPSARVVGIVRSFDRFNTGMRVEGNIKRVEYLRGLAAIHHAMREHGCRYGFILTEIELVVVRNGTEPTPHFGFLEVATVQLAASASGFSDADVQADQELTACLALWGLSMMAGDEPSPGQAHWKAEIGAPAEGTRRKALARDSWMPPPQLAEKREAKRARGWVLPEDPVGRKELGKRGVRYGGC